MPANTKSYKTILNENFYLKGRIATLESEKKALELKIEKMENKNHKPKSEKTEKRPKIEAIPETR